MIAPIQVHGNDLAATLSELKREGKYAWAMDIVGVAEYKLHINSIYGSTSNTDMDSQMGGKLATSQPVNAGNMSSQSTGRLEPESGTGFNKGVAPLRATPYPISIESRLDALRESLVAKGKLRPRREARKPYAD